MALLELDFVSDPGGHRRVTPLVPFAAAGYRGFRILKWETGKPESVEQVKVVNEYLADDSTILAYKLLSVKAGLRTRSRGTTSDKDVL